mgnify:CR=1 FL=1
MESDVVIADPLQVVTLLDELELNFDRLVEVVRYAEGERALCTKNDRKGFDLILMNDKAARGLREMFCGDRWAPDETDNQAGIRNSHIKVRVIHCNFDKNAGNPDAEPTNLVGKGTASRAKVACNRTPWIPGLPIPEPSEGEYTTYVLGTYSDENSLRAELSRPRSFVGGRYSRFEPRIILLDGSEGAPISGSKPADNGPTEIIDITIKRK